MSNHVHDIGVAFRSKANQKLSDDSFTGLDARLIGGIAIERTLRGCLKSPDSRHILSSMCLLQLPESWHEACTTSVNLALAGLFKHPLSVAVWVGLIALAGLDAETGVVMLLYLDQAWEKFVTQGRMRSLSDLYEAVKEGAVQRIRPKIMTVSAILFGLLPIMWSRPPRLARM
jgi:AcrB/AcrD/AcrF family